MATTLSLSTWIQALPIRLQRLLGTQQPSSGSSEQASTPKNPTEGTADQDDEWGDWVIPTPECEEQVKYATLSPDEPKEDERILFTVPLDEFIARQKAIACNGWKIEVGDKGRKPSDEEKEEDPFHLEEIHAGIRMPCNTPDYSDDIQDPGRRIVGLDPNKRMLAERVW